MDLGGWKGRGKEMTKRKKKKRQKREKGNQSHFQPTLAPLLPPPPLMCSPSHILVLPLPPPPGFFFEKEGGGVQGKTQKRERGEFVNILLTLLYGEQGNVSIWGKEKKIENREERRKERGNEHPLIEH